MFMHSGVGVNNCCSKAPESNAPTKLFSSVVKSYEIETQHHPEYMSTSIASPPPLSPPMPSAIKMTLSPIVKEKSCSDFSGSVAQPQPIHQEYKRLAVTPEMLRTVSLKPTSERLLKEHGC